MSFSTPGKDVPSCNVVVDFARITSIIHRTQFEAMVALSIVCWDACVEVDLRSVITVLVAVVTQTDL
jgi:hypothetical protein